MIGRLANGVFDTLDRAASSVSGSVSSLFEPPALRLGVTGLSQAGKTVFITALVANMLDRGRMGRMQAVSAGRIEAAYLQPQPDDTLPRFDYERHLAALTGPDPHWPEGTRQISQLRLSFRLRSGGLLGGLRGARIQHVDIIDYPGEWLLDLVLLDKTYDQWAADVLARLPSRPFAAEYLALATATDPTAPHDEAQARTLADAFTL